MKFFSKSLRTNYSRYGFTLVELALVLMIVGLLIGGVLRGQELWNNSRVTSTIKQVNSYDAAYVTFINMYSNFPGDMVNASTKMPGCETGNANGCVNGNGDGQIGTPTQIWVGGQQAVGTENTQFWKHLALSHLISGVTSSASAPIWGRSHPSSIFNGGFTVVQSTSGGGAQLMHGVVLRLHSCLTCDNTEDSGTGNGSGSPVSPKQASQIDKKMDDGMPGTGDVQSSAYGNGKLVEDCEVKYNEAREDPFCVMAFLLKR